MRTRWLAGALWAAFVVVLGASIYIGFNPPSGAKPIKVTDAIWASAIIGFPTVGALIATKMPRRPLGWILLVGPLFIMTGVFIGDGPVEARVAGAPYYATAANLLFSLGLTSLFTVPLFLPDGRLTSFRWRKVLAAIVIADAALVAATLFEPGRLSSYPRYVNPLGIEALRTLIDGIRFAEGPIFISTLIAGVVSVLIRYRSARGHARQQMKWLSLGLGAVAMSVLGIATLFGLGVDVPESVVVLFFVIAFLALPVSIGVAVFRFRLYDVDVIINRALVYSVLTALLLGAYLLGILLFRSVLPVASGSDFGVAASTLLAAAMFQPLRTRVQRIIDKRFYRRKYNAAATVAAFSARLRDEVELERIRDDVVSVVAETVQPVHASIWLRGAA